MCRELGPALGNEKDVSLIIPSWLSFLIGAVVGVVIITVFVISICIVVVIIIVVAVVIIVIFIIMVIVIVIVILNLNSRLLIDDILDSGVIDRIWSLSTQSCSCSGNKQKYI